MIRLSDNLWIGNSDDARSVKSLFGAMLNVARDLKPPLPLPKGIEFAQVGLIDGPGNEISDYCSAVLTLASLLKRYELVLVFGHDYTRPFVVGVMYLILKKGRGSSDASTPHRWSTWDKTIEELGEATTKISDISKEHKEACDKLPFSLLEMIL